MAGPANLLGIKLLITGSRKLQAAETAELIEKGLAALQEQGHPAPTLLLHGGAAGADTWAETWAQGQGLKTEAVLPDYGQYEGEAALLERNKVLAAKADTALALYARGRWRQGGTWDTAQKVIALGKPLLEMEARSDKMHYTPAPMTLF